ncbi:MAG: 3-oxoacyl-ACP synthase III family protein [Bdellovibrionales bacterium]
MGRQAKISGVGMCVPERLIPNSYFDELHKQDLGTFLREKRNIHQRYFMRDDQATSDLIVPAAEKALKAAGISAKDLQLIIVATDTPDFISPPTAAVVQHRLQATNAGVFDLNAACAGFVTGLDTAAKFIKADERYQNVLVVGAYGMSKHLDFADYKIASLFADGAGAAVLQPTENPQEGILASYLWADGQFHDAMGIYAGGTARPINQDVLHSKMHQLKFLRKIPAQFNAEHWPRIANLLLQKIGARAQDVNHYFLTQINIDSIHQTMDRLEVPRQRSHNIMNIYGYTGSACLPMAMADALEQGKLKKGDLVLMIGSGGGVAMGGAAIRWSY